jgi:hypothetical protein
MRRDRSLRATGAEDAVDLEVVGDAEDMVVDAVTGATDPPYIELHSEALHHLGNSPK